MLASLLRFLRSFDHLIRPCEHVGWNRYSDLLRRFEIDHQLKLRGLLHCVLMRGSLLTGARFAAEAGYTHALQIDADGQHQVSDIPRFLEQAAAHPQALIVGCPEYGKTVPSLRLYLRYLTHVWVWINTLSRQIKDSMCGFRVYPLPPMIALEQRQKLGERMNFDIEVLVRLYWDGLEIINEIHRLAIPATESRIFELCWITS